MQVDIQEGKTLYLEMLGVGHVTPAGERKVSFKLNGESRYVMVTDAAEATAGGGGGMERTWSSTSHVVHRYVPQIRGVSHALGVLQ